VRRVATEAHENVLYHTYQRGRQEMFYGRYNVGMSTSKKEASQAGKDLRDPKTPKRDRGPIASALAQSKKKGK
jgi:hypothetical protein